MANYEARGWHRGHINHRALAIHKFISPTCIYKKKSYFSGITTYFVIFPYFFITILYCTHHFSYIIGRQMLSFLKDKYVVPVMNNISSYNIRSY
jgi:hypothetical protein